MKFTERNIVFGFVFLLGMMLSHAIYLQHNSISLDELTSENKSTSGCFSSDSKVHEEDSVSNQIEFHIMVGIRKQPIHFQVPCRISQSLFTVWQPPKIS